MALRSNRYDDAIDRFISLDINPAKVVALYPSRISGKLARPSEAWEELFGGRSAESYLHSYTGLSSDTGPKTSTQDDQGSMRHSLKTKVSELSLQKPAGKGELSR